MLPECLPSAMHCIVLAAVHRVARGRQLDRLPTGVQATGSYYCRCGTFRVAE